MVVHFQNVLPTEIEKDNKTRSEVAIETALHENIGIGCNRGTERAEFESGLTELFQDLSLHRSSINNIASVDKKNDEVGLLEFAGQNSGKIDFFQM